MNADKKIVFMDGMFPAIFFPVGPLKDGGSCEYLTEECLKYCPSHEINEHETRALQYFEENDAHDIIDRIIKELCQESIMHLYWFSWGDCPETLTYKITKVMFGLLRKGVLQNGFTKNPHLWKTIPFDDRLRIGYHVDTYNEIIKLSTDKNIICLPDVDVGKAELYFKGEKIARCCGIWCEWVKEKTIRIADCQECYIYKKGCFIKD